MFKGFEDFYSMTLTCYRLWSPLGKQEPLPSRTPVSYAGFYNLIGPLRIGPFKKFGNGPVSHCFLPAGWKTGPRALILGYLITCLVTRFGFSDKTLLVRFRAAFSWTIDGSGVSPWDDSAVSWCTLQNCLLWLDSQYCITNTLFNDLLARCWLHCLQQPRPLYLDVHTAIFHLLGGRNAVCSSTHACVIWHNISTCTASFTQSQNPLSSKLKFWLELLWKVHGCLRTKTVPQWPQNINSVLPMSD